MSAGLRTRLLLKLAWLGAMARYDWRDASAQLARGVHSGIPFCCVTFFVLEWLPWARTGSEHPYAQDLEIAGLGRVRQEEQIRRWKAGEKPVETPPEYVPCPDCLATGRFVSIHTCTADCAGKPGGTPPLDGAKAKGCAS